MGTLEKAFHIIQEVVAHQETGLHFSEVLARTDYPRSTVHKILKSLVNIGCLRHEEETGRYSGGLLLTSLGAAVLASFNLRKHVRPHLIELHRKTGHACNLAIRDEWSGVYIDRIESSDFGIKLFSEVGQHFPLHSTGLGRAIMAFEDPAIWEEFFRTPLKTFTPMTITEVDLLLEELRNTRERGYAEEDQETFRGLMCLSAPILGPKGRVLAAVSVAFPSFVKEERDITPDIEAVLTCARNSSFAIKGNEGDLSIRRRR